MHYSRYLFQGPETLIRQIALTRASLLPLWPVQLDFLPRVCIIGGQGSRRALNSEEVGKCPEV